MDHSRKVDRFTIAALVDRLIYGAEMHFDQNDAITLYKTIPPEMLRGGLSDWFQVSAKGSVSYGNMAGSSPGHGEIRVPTDGSSFDFDSAGRRVVRAGQWKIYAKRNRLEIEQVMASGNDEGRVARIDYQRGMPVRMEILGHKVLSLGFIKLTLGVFRPWKYPLESNGHPSEPTA